MLALEGSDRSRCSRSVDGRHKGVVDSLLVEEDRLRGVCSTYGGQVIRTENSEQMESQCDTEIDTPQTYTRGFMFLVKE